MTTSSLVAKSFRSKSERAGNGGNHDKPNRSDRRAAVRGRGVGERTGRRGGGSVPGWRSRHGGRRRARYGKRRRHAPGQRRVDRLDDQGDYRGGGDAARGARQALARRSDRIGVAGTRERSGAGGLLAGWHAEAAAGARRHYAEAPSDPQFGLRLRQIGRA